MNIVMYVPGMPFSGHTIAQGRSLGGSETAGYWIARTLAERGHAVTMFSNVPQGEEGIAHGVLYIPIGQIHQGAQLGENFERYARHTPHDILLGQRTPNLFAGVFASKLNIWWTHDLALQRMRPMIGSQMWNVDAVMAVSEWHRNQVCKVYDLPPEVVFVLRNAIDPERFKRPVDSALRKKSLYIMYSSRPERGLSHLVETGGIMERLEKIAPEITLKVAWYDNVTPEMRGLYEHLWNRANARPNVELLGPLGQDALARHMQGAWLHVYPTTFEEVSCITAMEAQAAGTPVIANPCAALPETLSGNAGVAWVLGEGDDDVNLQSFVQHIVALRDEPERWDVLHAKAVEKSNEYRWGASVDALEATISELFKRRTSNTTRLYHHLIRHGDALLANTLDAGTDLDREWVRNYGFTRSDKAFLEHYEALATWEKKSGLTQGRGDDDFLMNARITPVFSELSQLPPGSRVLDYGCGQGQHIELFARKLPLLHFTGVDISAQSIRSARDYMAEHPAQNVAFWTLAEFKKEQTAMMFDAVFATEVLEHVTDPAALIAQLEGYLRIGGALIVTTPWGPWEQDGRVKHPAMSEMQYKLQAQVHFHMHLHHFENKDLQEMFGGKPGFRIAYAPCDLSEIGMPKGCFVMVWHKDEHQPATCMSDRERKLREQAPMETLGIMMICRPDSPTLGKSLENLRGIAQQIVIGFDGGPDGKREGGIAWDTAKRFGALTFPIVSPLVQGFGAARNDVLARMTTDWGFWIDDDEVITHPERIPKYLRPSMYNAYLIAQHHYSAEPVGNIKTDYPCRLIRLDKGLRFWGLVHEHPETEINKGVGGACVMGDVSIMHNGYETEDIRRARFMRNLPLMLRERQDNPHRLLGKMLWVRDLTHLIQFDTETGCLTPQVGRARAEDAIALWRELADAGETRMVVESLPYYSQCAQLLYGPMAIRFACAMGAKRLNIGSLNGQPPSLIEGMFTGIDDIHRLTACMEKDALSAMTDRYF